MREEEKRLVADRLLALSTMAAGIAHEINNPLGFVIGNLEFLRGDLPPRNSSPQAEEQHAAIDDALSGARRVRDIVTDLSAFTHDTDQTALRPVDLLHVLRLSLTMAQSSLANRVTVSVNVPEGLSLLGNGSRLGQVFLNLLTNAAQAMPERIAAENSVVISARAEGAFVRVEVKDNGRGMTEEVRRRAFDPFFTTRPVGTGTGLGLSIVHGIVSQFGGAISLSSAPNEGCVVTLTFPRVEADHLRALVSSTLASSAT